MTTAKLSSAATSTQLLAVSGLVCLSSMAGCVKQNDNGGSSTPEAGHTAENAKSGASATVGAAGRACETLSSKLCERTGDQTMTCVSARTALSLLSDAACGLALEDFSVTEQKLAGRGKKCAELVEKLCEGVGKETETCQRVLVEGKNIEPEQCVMMLANIDDIVADLKNQEAANQPLTREQQALIAAPDAPAFGPVDAKVTVVAFSDFECPYCSHTASVAKQVRDKYVDTVRFVFRHFPLAFHQHARGAAQAAQAAHSQGKFWEFHDKIFANQAHLDRSTLEGYAQELGLDMTEFKAELDSKQHESRVESDVNMGGQVAVQGTPTMFVNGKRVDNPTDFAEVAGAIDAALGG
jgi:protein-disulfide isomerase